MTETNGESEEIEVRLLLEAIEAKYGYDLRGYSPSSMRRRILASLAKSGLSHIGELQHKVLTNSEFFVDVLDDLTVHVSEMFRDPHFYQTLRSHVFPILRTYPSFKIWHAGCATGEEVYATAILLMEEELYERCQIYATDLSVQALQQAKEGTYPANQVPRFTENYQASGGKKQLSDYFTEAYDHLTMKDFLRKNIVFFQHNLVSDHVFGEMNVLFCRNVFIYFGSDLKLRVINKFSQSLCHSGFLCLGASERLMKSETLDDAFLEFVSGSRIYRYKK